MCNSTLDKDLSGFFRCHIFLSDLGLSILIDFMTNKMKKFCSRIFWIFSYHLTKLLPQHHSLLLSQKS